MPANKIGGKARAMVVTSGIERAIKYYHAFNAYLTERKSPYQAIVAFSGEHDYGGGKVSEVSLNGFPSREITTKFQADPYRFLICADKFQTGYDEPLLHTMYVDKPLSGIKAVQTLSRLNRAHPEKRECKKLKNDDLLITTLSGTILRMCLDKIPLWRGNHVMVRQLVDDFARYSYLPRLKDTSVLVQAIREGVSFATWTRDGFGFADNFDEAACRYQGLRGGKLVPLNDADAPGMLVKPDVAQKQLAVEQDEAQIVAPAVPGGDDRPGSGTGSGTEEGGIAGPAVPAEETPEDTAPKRFHGTVALDTARVGRDAGRIAEEVIAHLSGLVGANVTVTLEVEADIPEGAPDHVVRTVTENCRVLKFENMGFEKE